MSNVGALLITTQVYENYAFDANGSPDAENPHWKAKGGDDIIVTGVDLDSTEMEVDYIVDALRETVEQDNAMFREYIIGTQLVAADYVVYPDCAELEAYVKRIPNPREA